MLILGEICFVLFFFTSISCQFSSASWFGPNLIIIITIIIIIIIIVIINNHHYHRYHQRHQDLYEESSRLRNTLHKT